MNLELLDNPGWHALNSHHRHLAIWGDLSARYPADVFIGAAMPENNRAGFADLRSIVELNEDIGVLGLLPENLEGWQVLHKARIP